MKPPRRENKDYEKVATDDFVVGVIEDIQYEEEHSFGKWPDKVTKEPVEKKGPAVRFKFKIKNYQYNHFSRWMYFGYGERSNLYNKYIVPLVEGAVPDMDFDLDNLKRMEVKMLWSEKNGFQSIETIRPLHKKIVSNTQPPSQDIAEEHDNNEQEILF